MYASTETNNWEITIFLGPIIYLLRMYQVPNYKSKQHVPVICISQHIVKPLCIKNWQYSWRCELYISFYSFMTIRLGSVLWGFRIIKMKKKESTPKGMYNLVIVRWEGMYWKEGDKQNITWAEDWPSQLFKLKD